MEMPGPAWCLDLTGTGQVPYHRCDRLIDSLEHLSIRGNEGRGGCFVNGARQDFVLAGELARGSELPGQPSDVKRRHACAPRKGYQPRINRDVSICES